MTTGLTIVDYATIITPLFVAGLAWAQWRTSEANIERRRLEEKRDETRKRDVELLHWGDRVISCMARIETLCEGWNATLDKPQAWALTAEASSLVDQGRLFFPNVESEAQFETEDGGTRRRGLRVAILDEVVRAYLVAKLAVSEADAELQSLTSKIRDSRRRFVTRLQQEMGESLSKSAQDRAGQSIPRDPRTW